jgi:hypothetical protein
LSGPDTHEEATEGDSAGDGLHGTSHRIIEYTTLQGSPSRYFLPIRVVRLRAGHSARRRLPAWALPRSQLEINDMSRNHLDKVGRNELYAF